MTGSARVGLIEKDLIEQISNRKSAWANLGLFVLSILLFVSFGLLNNVLNFIITLVVIILIHEAGHFIGMKLYGYKNVNVFFIPLFGAATSGVETNQSGGRKAIISLLGPVPGIIIGVVLGFIYLRTKNEFYLQPARIFLFLNAFNLLPFLPLDGGRVIDNLLFPRNVKIEIVFKVVSGLGLIGVAYLLRSPLLGIFAIGFLISIKKTYNIGSIAKELKNNIPLEDQINDINIQKKYIPEIDAQLKNKFSMPISPKETAKHIISVWQRLCNLPPKKGVVFGLGFIYVFLVCFAVVATFIFEAGVAYSQTERKIEYADTNDGQKIKREVLYYKGKYIGYTEVSSSNLYHGKSENYYIETGKLKRSGQWYHGKWDGEWQDYDQEGNVIRKTILDKGHLIVIKELKGGTWTEKSIDNLPKLMRMPYIKHENGPPEGPKVRKDKIGS